MNTTANIQAARSPDGRSSGLRRLWAIDERARFIDGAQTVAGRLLIYVIACAAVKTYFPWWETLLVVSAAMAAAYVPRYRSAVLFAATWTAAFLEMALLENFIVEEIGVVVQLERVAGPSPLVWATGFLLLLMAGAWGALAAVRRRPTSILARRPLVILLTLEALLCGLTTLDVTHGLPRVMLWSLITVLTPYIWFLPYAIVDMRSQHASPMSMQMATLRPFWSPSFLPFGKGSAFLRKHLPKTPADLAVTQLKAIKLLLWSNVLLAFKIGLTWVFEEHLHIPTVEMALDAFLAGHAYRPVTGWACLVLSTAKYGLTIGFWAGLFIGIARLAGYRLPRGSWRPLESRTLMEYFNRFHYYFKELLVDFFFVPTFFTLFRRHPRLRMFFATFMAAGVGNALWHFLRQIDTVATMGLAASAQAFTSYLFYAVILATGIGLSQVRASRGIRPSSTVYGRVYSFLLVWSFVVGLHVFGAESARSFGERLSFMASLFGVS